MQFEDCTAPPAGVVDAFVRAADAAEGLVAVHCKVLDIKIIIVIIIITIIVIIIIKITKQ